MRIHSIATSAAIFVGAAICSSPVLASSQDSGGFSVSLSVPVVCDIEAADFVLDKNQNIVRGVVNEYCNSSRGFQILAGHRPLESGEQIDLDYDGTATSLDASGLSTIAFRSGARFGPVPVAIRTQGVIENLAVSFSVTAI